MPLFVEYNAIYSNILYNKNGEENEDRSNFKFNDRKGRLGKN